MPVECFFGDLVKIIAETSNLDAAEQWSSTQAIVKGRQSSQFEAGPKFWWMPTGKQCTEMWNYQVGYSRIRMESATVRYMVKGLMDHPKFCDFAQRLRLSGLLDSIHVLEERLLEEEAALTEKVTFNMQPTNVPYESELNQQMKT